MLMGGPSAEREVSLSTGRECARALRGEGYEVVEVSDAERSAIAETVRKDVWPGIGEIVGQDVIDRLMAPSN